MITRNFSVLALIVISGLIGLSIAKAQSGKAGQQVVNPIQDNVDSWAISKPQKLDNSSQDSEQARKAGDNYKSMSPDSWGSAEIPKLPNAIGNRSFEIVDKPTVIKNQTIEITPPLSAQSINNSKPSKTPLSEIPELNDNVPLPPSSRYNTKPQDNRNKNQNTKSKNIAEEFIWPEDPVKSGSANRSNAQPPAQVITQPVKRNQDRPGISSENRTVEPGTIHIRQAKPKQTTPVQPSISKSVVQEPGQYVPHQSGVTHSEPVNSEMIKSEPAHSSPESAVSCGCSDCRAKKLIRRKSNTFGSGHIYQPTTNVYVEPNPMGGSLRENLELYGFNGQVKNRVPIDGVQRTTRFSNDCEGCSSGDCQSCNRQLRQKNQRIPRSNQASGCGYSARSMGGSRSLMRNYEAADILGFDDPWATSAPCGDPNCSDCGQRSSMIDRFFGGGSMFSNQGAAGSNRSFANRGLKPAFLDNSPQATSADPNYTPALGHRSNSVTNRPFGNPSTGCTDCEEYGQDEHYPPMSEILATGKYFMVGYYSWLEPSLQGNTAIGVNGGQSLAFNFDWASAPQFKVGFESEYGPGMQLGYFQFDQDSNPVSYTSNGLATANVSTWMMGPGAFTSLPATAAGETLTARHSLEVQRGDILLFKAIKFKRAYLTGKYGLQYATIRHELYATRSSGGVLDATSELHAFGPKVGFEYVRRMGHTPLEFVASFAGSLLYGDRDQDVMNTYNGDSSNIVGADEFTTLVDYSLGVQRIKRLGTNRSLTAKLDFVSQTWIGGGTAVDPQSDFGFQGFRFGFGVNQ